MKFPRQKAGWIGVIVYAIFGALPVFYSFLVTDFNFPDIAMYFSGGAPEYQFLYFYPLIFSPGYGLAVLLPDSIISQLPYSVFIIAILLINLVFFYWLGVLVKKIFTKSPAEPTQK
ncbi:MAG: hypothetical protein WCX12_01075 [Candidatus Paceibacterota bacterium]|jgi:hypothetical protein